MIRYRPEIDGLRAIAITSVILFHAWSSTFPGGFVGVDIFFVISGYLITSLIVKEREDGHFSFASFYARRARRILPAFLAMTLVSTIGAIVMFLPHDLAVYGRMVIYALLFGANFRLAASPGYFHDSMQENPLLHMWSLSVEEQFYAVWPILLILMARFIPTRRKFMTVALCAASLIAAEVLVQIWPKSAFFHLPTRGWELLVGAMLAMGLFPKIGNNIAANVLSLGGLCLMIAPLFLYTKETAFPGVAALAPVLGAAFLIQGTEGQRGRITASLSSKPVVFIGLISYSLYLWHWPILAFATYALARPLQPSEASLCVLIAFAAAVFSWRYVEQPFRKRSAGPLRVFPVLKGFSVPALTPSGYAALTLTVILIAFGSFFQKSKGAPWRLAPEVRRLTENHVPWLSDICISEKRTKGNNLTECQFGDTSTNVIVWGDSHSQHYLPVFVKAFGHGRAYITYGCSPLKEESGSGQPADCQSNNRHVLNEILRLKPKIVIMASYWNAPELHYRMRGRPTDFAQIILGTVNILTDAGIKVVLMGQVPEMNTSSYKCITRFNFLGLADCDDGVPREEAERAQFNAYQALTAIAQSNPNVFLFRPYLYTCDQTRCFASRDDSILYFDNNHLTAAGALALAEPFDKELPQSFRPEARSEWTSSSVDTHAN
jgi:peptidoglycan/LPS O-acetylase OafA/YrhL